MASAGVPLRVLQGLIGARVVLNDRGVREMGAGPDGGTRVR
jgi:hypothetical protein